MVPNGTDVLRGSLALSYHQSAVLEPRKVQSHVERGPVDGHKHSGSACFSYRSWSSWECSSGRSAPSTSLQVSIAAVKRGSNGSEPFRATCDSLFSSLDLQRTPSAYSARNMCRCWPETTYCGHVTSATRPARTSADLLPSTSFSLSHRSVKQSPPISQFVPSCVELLHRLRLLPRHAGDTD